MRKKTGNICERKIKSLVTLFFGGQLGSFVPACSSLAYLAGFNMSCCINSILNFLKARCQLIVAPGTLGSSSEVWCKRAAENINVVVG